MTVIHKEVYGQGPALVMIPGWGMHSGVWRDFARCLASRYQVICLDLPGHGQSENIAPFSLANIAEHLLNTIPVQKFNLLGWSLGASVALALADKHPDRLLSLILLAGNPCFVQTADWPGIQPQLLDDFIQQLADNPALTQQRFLSLQVKGALQARQQLQSLKAALRGSRPAAPAALLGGLNILKQHDLRPQLHRAPCPVHFIQGDCDALIPPACTTAIKAIQPKIHCHLLKNAGHAPFLSHSPALQAILFTNL